MIDPMEGLMYSVLIGGGLLWIGIWPWLAIIVALFSYPAIMGATE